MKIYASLAVGLLVGLLSCPSLVAAPEPPSVTMIADSPQLQPSSTVELRFPSPMVTRDEVGLPVKDSPIVITPVVPGNFTWVSRSSGVFVPSSPWPMGQEFTVSLRRDLKSPDGKPLTFRATLSTPAFAMSVYRSDSDDLQRASPMPKIAFAYNLAVDPTTATKFFQFVDAKGKKIAATVRAGTRSDYLSVKPEQDDWEERWRLAHTPPKAESDDDLSEEDYEARAAEPIPSRLAVTPVEPLTPGSTWRLEMLRGLPAKSGPHRLAEPFTVPIGLVQPFALSSVTPSNYINSGRSVVFEFSHSLAPDLTEDRAEKHFRFEPAVPNLTFEGFSTTITAHGDFELGRDYKLIVDPTIVSIDGLAYQGAREKTFRFSPVAPRLYLPTITGHQIRNGQRKFEVLSGNLAALHVVARVVAPTEVAKGVEAFANYNNQGNDNPEEPYQRMPDGTIKGQVIYDKKIEIPAVALDAKQNTALDWNEILGAQNAGVVFLTIDGEPLKQVGGKRPGAQALIQLTDLGVLWKKTNEGLRVTVFSMENGQPLTGVSAALSTPDHVELKRGTTNAEGLVTLPFTKQPGWLVVRKDADTHALRIGEEGTDLPMSAFRVPIEYHGWEPMPAADLALRGIVFTDRPLYRPGEVVNVKGIVRDAGAAGLSVRQGLVGTLKLTDPRGRNVAETEVKLDARGGFDTQITLTGGSVGSYGLTAEISVAGEESSAGSFRTKFEVADFQPNAFEMEVPLASRLAPGAKVSTAVTAKYLFGAPLTKADARWTLRYVREVFEPTGYGGWRFGDEDENGGKILTLRGEGTYTAAQGFKIEPQLPEVKDVPYRGVLTVELTDLNQQTVSESREFTRDAAEFYLGVSVPDGVVIKAGEPVPVRAIAVQPDGQPAKEPVDITAEIVRVRYETVRVQGAGKAISFRTENIEEPFGKATGRTLIPEKLVDQWDVREGSSLSFKSGEPGQYRVKITARDRSGHAVTSVLPVFVSGAAEVSWDYRNPAQVDLVPDKAEYQPGDKARLLIKTPISGEALVTIERGDRILRTQRVRLEGNAPSIEVPLEKADAPNVFVSVVLLRGREQSTKKFKMPEYRYGVTMLKVSDPVQHLAVEVSTPRAQVEPGDEVETVIRVRDGSGAAVRDAEVTFFAVDDGILALTGYSRPAPQSIFDAPISLAVRTGLSLFELLPEDPGDLEFANKGYLIGGGGLEGPGLKLRQNFPGTACWFPSLRTGADGVVRAKFKAPDALTRYRLVAVASAGAKLFGSAESAVAIRQPLSILASLGQFANVGDQLLARAVVRNDTGTDGAVDVSLQLDSTARSAGKIGAALSERIEVKNGETRAIDFPIELKSTGQAEWKWSARMEVGGKKFADQVVSTLSVGSAAPILRETYLPDLAAASTDLLAGVNPQLLEGTGVVTVSLSNTRLGALREATDQLLVYPYGCAEQTVSSLIPWALLPELRTIIPELTKTDEQAKGAIDKGLTRLFSMQTPGGGLAYWPGGKEPSLFASAYGALVCALLTEHEVEIPAGHDALLEYLSKQLRGTGTLLRESELADRALAVYALALSDKAEPAYHEELYRRRKELSLESRALVALAIGQSGGPAAMIKELLNPKTTAPESFSWFGGGARERAVQLLAWTKTNPRSPEVARLTKELMGYQINGNWITTQQNAWSLLALTRYYKAVESGTKEIKGTLTASGGTVPFRVTKEKPTATESFPVGSTLPLKALAVQNPAKSALVGEVRFLVRSSVDKQPRQDRGYAVSRSYQKLAEDGSFQEAKGLKVGDRVLVTLRVETQRPGHFIAIDDPLPSILEAINPAFKSQAAAPGDAAVQEGVSDYQEVRADRVLYFCDHLPAGAYTFRYLARVRAAGTSTAGATKVEEMYRPERFGLSETMQLVSVPSDAK